MLGLDLCLMICVVLFVVSGFSNSRIIMIITKFFLVDASDSYENGFGDRFRLAYPRDAHQMHLLIVFVH